MKDELITGAELAQRLGVSQAYITKQKKSNKLTGCTYGKKYYFIKTCKALGRNPDDPKYEKSKTSTIPTQQKKLTKKTTDKKKYQKESHKSNIDENSARTLLEQIMEVINDEKSSYDKALLDNMKTKASMLKEYFLARNEEIKNRKLEENLFTKDEVLQILSASMSMIRSAMINMPNNYAVNLENSDKAMIKEYVTDDINKILSDLQSVGEQFEKSNF